MARIPGHGSQSELPDRELVKGVLLTVNGLAGGQIWLSNIHNRIPGSKRGIVIAYARILFEERFILGVHQHPYRKIGRRSSDETIRKR